VQQPSLDAYLASVSDPRIQGRVQGAFTTIGMTGAAVSAFLGSVLYGIAPVIPFLTGGVVLGLLTAVAVLRFIRPTELSGYRLQPAPVAAVASSDTDAR